MSFDLELALVEATAVHADLLPVLIGPPGPAPLAPPTSPVFTFDAGRLASVLYADGSTKTMTYTGDQLTQVDFLQVGQPGLRKTFSYNPDGTLAAVVTSTI